MIRNVSVIIPAYNGSDYLNECLESVLSQTLQETEIICVDDGSADGTAAILNQFAEKDKRITVITQEHSGVAAARNRGLSAAQGEYVVFMDADDFYPQDDILETLYRKAKESGAEICGGCFSIYNENTKEIVTTFGGDLVGYVFEKEGWIDYSDYQFDFGYHRFIYKRKFLIENELCFPPYKRYQDPVFFVRAMIKAKSFYALDKVTYCYREGHQNQKNWSDEMWRDQTLGMSDVADFARENGLENLLKLTVARGLHHFEVMYKLYSSDLNFNCENIVALQDFLIRNDPSLKSVAAEYFGGLVQKIVNEKKEIEKSFSFRLGRALTFIPRKIREAIRRKK